YLRDETVEARHPTRIYRFRKLIRQHFWGFAASLAVAISLILAVIVLAVSTLRVTAERNAKAAAFLTAEQQRKVSQQNAEEAHRQQGIAVDQERLARHRFYAAQMNLAMQAWEANQPARTLELLESQRPRFDDEDLRGFEWYYLWQLCQGSCYARL